VTVLSVIHVEWHKNMFLRTEVLRSGIHHSFPCLSAAITDTVTVVMLWELPGCQVAVLQHFWFLCFMQRHDVKTCREEAKWLHALLIP
jgi:hypothetical protein